MDFNTHAWRQVALTLLAMILMPAQAWAQSAQNFPNKPIHIIVPFTAGGTTDMLARSIGQKMTELWGQPVVVESRPGAAGWLGIGAMSRMPPDSYNIGVTLSNIIYAKSLYTKLPFDMEKDFAPVAMISRSPIVLAVLPGFSANSLKEFVDLVRASPGKYSYASFGQGTTSHIFGETLKLNAKLDLVHIPYKGAAPQVSDLLGGHVSSAFLDTGTALPLVQTGKIKMLAISGIRRLANVPALPTFLEQGYKGFEPVGFFQALAPAGTPPDILNKLADAVDKAVNSPELKARIIDLGQEPGGGKPEELAAAIRNDAAIFDETIKRSNIKVDQN
ncbi:MAG: Bug family tripartite tricarboxylate transporter substrate binding protein [Rhodoferax sp.]